MGPRDPNTECTPYRKTHVFLSCADTVSSFGPFSESRANGTICAGGLTPDNNTNIFRLSQGGYCLTPISVESHFLRERMDNAGAVLQTSDFTLAEGLVVVPGFKSPVDLPGVTTDPNVATTGNNFIRKNVKSTNSFSVAALAADAASYPSPTLPTANVTMDRHAVSKKYFQENQGYYFTFLTPNQKLSNSDFVAEFMFGGPVTDDGSGQYGLALGGDGNARLYELLSASNLWVKRDQWQYTLPQRNAGLMESIMVFPYSDPISGQNFIEFRSGIVAAAPSVHAIVAVAAEAAWYAQGAPSTHLYTCHVKRFTPAVGVPAPPVRRYATGQGPVRVDIRRDNRMPWQVALLMFAQTGEMADLPFFVPHQISPASPLVLSWSGNIPDGTTLEGSLFDATTGIELTMVSGGTNIKTYQGNAGQPMYFAKFFFTSSTDQTRTPILTQYSVTRDSVYIDQPNDPLEMEPADGTHLARRVARTINISGPEEDPSHETAVVRISDITNTLAELHDHAFFPIRVESEYDPDDETLRSVYFQGYVTRAEAHRWGSGTQSYPSPQAKDFECRAVGQWARLHKAYPPRRQRLFPDESAAVDPKTGGYPGLKITDVIRNAFGWAGYSPDMIDVPDHPIRFFPPANGDANAIMMDPLTNLADFIEKTAADYLGWFVIFDPNAGVDNKGMWRLVPSKRAPYTNLASFVTSAAAGKVPHVPASYGTTNWVTSMEQAVVQAPIIKGTLKTVPKPPEANKVVVTASGDVLPNKSGLYSLYQTAQNISSYDCLFDNSGNLVHTADPTSPDWLGFESVLYYIDPTLQNQDLVDIVCRRLYDFTCHGTRLATFEAPLVLVWDPNDAQQIRPRPLRYYDPVLIGGAQYLVRTVNPYYTFDGKQFGRYECETPRF